MIFFYPYGGGISFRFDNISPGIVLGYDHALGTTGKGAQRWLDLGIFRFQPSEIMKLAVPMMLVLMASIGLYSQAGTCFKAAA